MNARRVQIALVGALVLALAAGCDFPPKADWVERAAEAHRIADEALARGDHDGARDALAAFVDAPRPLGMQPDDRRTVVQDACFRLATIELSADRARESLAWAERGLVAGRGDDVVTANLLIARGRAREALGREREAAVDYYVALEINEKLLSRALGGER